jgi:hypothetical protein
VAEAPPTPAAEAPPDEAPPAELGETLGALMGAPTPGEGASGPAATAPGPETTYGPTDYAGPVPRVRTGAAIASPGLSAELIRRVVRRHINEVRFCYESELVRATDLAGRVEIAFTVEPTGAVTGPSVASSTLSSATSPEGPATRVASCIAGAVGRWTFPAPDGGARVSVTYPFVLSGDESADADTAEPHAPPPSSGGFEMGGMGRAGS